MSKEFNGEMNSLVHYSTSWRIGKSRNMMPKLFPDVPWSPTCHARKANFALVENKAMLAFLQLHARCRVRNLLVIPNRMLPPHYDDVVSTQNFDKIPLQDALTAKHDKRSSRKLTSLELLRSLDLMRWSTQTCIASPTYGRPASITG